MTARVTRHKFKSNLLQLLRLIWNYLERVSAAHRASSRFWESCLSTCTCTRGSMSFVMMKMQKLKKTTAMRFTIIALPSSCFSLSMWDLWICISTEDFTVLQYYIMCEQLTSVLNVIIWKEDWRKQNLTGAYFTAGHLFESHSCKLLFNWTNIQVWKSF